MIGFTGLQKQCCQGGNGLEPNEAYEYRAYCLIKPHASTMIGLRKEQAVCSLAVCCTFCKLKSALDDMSAAQPRQTLSGYYHSAFVVYNE
jgi:hypothetical protein